MNITREIKKKREFSRLPDSIVERAAEVAKGDVKESRALLRKYFGVFLTNKILKGTGSPEEILKFHMSSKKRDYEEFYGDIFSDIGNVGSVIDLGAGVNGFSYSYLKKELGALRQVPSDEGNVHYLAVEAAGQVVDNMNFYFKDRGLERAHALQGDLFDVEKIVKLLKGFEDFKPRVVFMFQVVDALENLERDFSKKFILKISKSCEKIVLTLPTESLGGRKKFVVQRKWLFDFLEENFEIEKDFKMFGERIIIFRR